MPGQETDGPVALEAPGDSPQLLGASPIVPFDWVDFKYSCPNCGRLLSGFQTRDLCNTLDTVDYRIAYHFYAECKCGTWIDFIRRPAGSIEDFDVRMERREGMCPAGASADPS